MSEAIAVARKAAGAWCKSIGFTTSHRENDMPDAIAQAFEDSGLLVTPLHKRALEACERFASSGYQPYQQVAIIGRESLAAKEATKPKPPWTVVKWPEQGGCYQVRTERGAVAWFTSEADANADCERRNKQEAKP